MGAFDTLATAESVKPELLAGDIRVALVTTASGLAIAIPLMILVATVNIRISKMEDLVGAGLPRFFEAFKAGLAKIPAGAQAAGGNSLSADRAEPAAVYRESS
jgi:biopolymer transport protein ExbB